MPASYLVKLHSFFFLIFLFSFEGQLIIICNTAINFDKNRNFNIFCFNFDTLLFNALLLLLHKLYYALKMFFG